MYKNDLEIKLMVIHDWLVIFSMIFPGVGKCPSSKGAATRQLPLKPAPCCSHAPSSGSKGWHFRSMVPVMANNHRSISWKPTPFTNMRLGSSVRLVFLARSEVSWALDWVRLPALPSWPWQGLGSFSAEWQLDAFPWLVVLPQLTHVYEIPCLLSREG